ncbi:DNA polymerase-3 subunit beta [Bradyrhizobium diazoefficiens]
MKIAATAAAIDSALSLAATARQRDALVSITAGEGITVTGSDAGMTIRAAVAGKVIEPGAAAVSADRLAALIAGFDPAASISISTSANAVTVERYRLPRADMPATHELAGETGRVEIRAADCIDLLAVASAASSEKSPRFILSGVFLQSVSHQLVAVATSGVKLLRRSITAETFSAERDLIVPTRATITLTRLIRQTKAGRITLRRSRKLFAASGTGFEFVSRLIDGAFPDYLAILPAPSPTSVTVERAELQAALARLTAIASGDFPLVALTWTDGEPLRMFLPRQPGDGTDDIAADSTGSARIALVPAQLAAMLSEFTCQRVHLNDAAGRLLITSESQMLGLLMPCVWNFGQEAAAAVA